MLIIPRQIRRTGEYTTFYVTHGKTPSRTTVHGVQGEWQSAGIQEIDEYVQVHK